MITRSKYRGSEMENATFLAKRICNRAQEIEQLVEDGERKTAINLVPLVEDLLDEFLKLAIKSEEQEEFDKIVNEAKAKWRPIRRRVYDPSSPSESSFGSVSSLDHDQIQKEDTAPRSQSPVPRTTPAVQYPPSNYSPAHTQKLKWPIFSGDRLDYLRFRRDFSVISKNSNQSSDVLLQQLFSHCLPNYLKKQFSSYSDIEEIWKDLNQMYLSSANLESDVHKILDKNACLPATDHVRVCEFISTIEATHRDLKEIDQIDIIANQRALSKLVNSFVNNSSLFRALSLIRNAEGGDNVSKFNNILSELKGHRTSLLSIIPVNPSDRHQKSKNDDRQFHKKTGNVNVAVKSDQKRSFVCLAPGCKKDRYHQLPFCDKFDAMDLEARADLVVKNKLCTFCLGRKHDRDECNKKKLWRSCEVDQCGGWHSQLLHGSTNPSIVLTAGSSIVNNSDVLLLALDVPLSKCSSKLLVLFDTGATINLISNSVAKRLNLHGVKQRLTLEGVGQSRKNFDTVLYCVPLKDKWGNMRLVQAYGLDKISTDIQPSDLTELANRFNLSASEITRPAGAVELLLGINCADILPRPVRYSGSLALYTSIFSGKFLVGGSASLDQKIPRRNNMERALFASLPDILTTDSLGVSPTSKCRACSTCSDCVYRASHMSTIDALQLRKLEEGLQFDRATNRWSVTLSFIQPPETLKNNRAQVKNLMIKLEDRLEKCKLLKIFNEQFLDCIQRGVYRQLSEEEIQRYSGPVHYTTLTEAHKDSVSTPLRLCANSSLNYKGISFNSLLLKGPSTLNNMFNILTRFRLHEIGFCMDITKFYNQIELCERDQHLQRVLWRNGDKNAESYEFVTQKLTFGIVPAGTIAQSALRETARQHSDVSRDAAKVIKEDCFVDDIVSGASSSEKTEILISKIKEICSLGGFSFKNYTRSYDETDPVKILGILWTPKSDEISTVISLSLAPKVRGRRESDQVQEKFKSLCENSVELTRGQVQQVFEGVHITRRILLRIVASFYDPLGLYSIFTIKLRIIFRNALILNPKGQWDDVVPQSISDDLFDLLTLLPVLKSTLLPRCVLPKGESASRSLVGFADASTSAVCATLFVRTQIGPDQFANHLLVSKSKIAPIKKTSIPRLELIGCLLLARLTYNVKQSVSVPFDATILMTDSAPVLAMMRQTSAVFGEFVGTRVAEIQSKTDTESEWWHVDTANNLADIGTRSGLCSDDLRPDSAFFTGQKWMSKPTQFWPIVHEPAGSVPREELSNLAKTVLVASVPNPVYIVDMEKFSLKKIRNILYQVLKCVCILRKYDCSRDNIYKSVDTLICYQSQVDMFKRFNKGEFSHLRASVTQTTFLNRTLGLLTTSGRLASTLLVGYDVERLPIIDSGSILAKLHLEEAHSISHASHTKTLDLSRRKVWVIKGRRIAQTVVKQCFECKRRSANLQNQLMGPLPDFRVVPSPVFTATSCDICGPYLIKDIIKKRAERKVYVLIFCCLSTTALHCEILADYTANEVVNAFLKFIAVRGSPKLIYCDQGSQLKAAAKRRDLWLGSNQLEWRFCPPTGQHFNGLAEKLVHLLKKQLLPLLAGQILRYGEFETILRIATSKVNSRPLSAVLTEDSQVGSCLTPNHALIGRASPDDPLTEIDLDASLSKRAAFVQHVLDSFWKKYVMIVLPRLVFHSPKWNVQSRNLKIGDVVLMTDTSVLSKRHVLGRVVGVEPSSDGLVRRVSVRYVVPGTKDCKTMTVDRPVHKLVLLVPAGDKDSPV